MPAFNGVAAGHEVDTKKRSTDEIASGVTTSLLILIVTFFTCGSLWLGIFAIPAFFAFFRASVVTVSSIREVRASRQQPAMRTAAVVVSSAQQQR